jgi:hypothetical protein
MERVWAKQVKRLTKQAMEEITEENERMELTKSGDDDGRAEDSDSAEGACLRSNSEPEVWG